jgi:hypothetical protein
MANITVNVTIRPVDKLTITSPQAQYAGMRLGEDVQIFFGRSGSGEAQRTIEGMIRQLQMLLRHVTAEPAGKRA